MRDNFRVGIGIKCFIGHSDRDYKLTPIGEDDRSADSVETSNSLLIHSLCEAMIGAAGLGTLQIPYDTGLDKQLKDVDQQVHYTGYKVNNIDISLRGFEKNDLNEQRQIISSLAQLLFVKEEQINLKHSDIFESIQPQPSQSVECYSIVSLRTRQDL